MYEIKAYYQLGCDYRTSFVGFDGSIEEAFSRIDYLFQVQLEYPEALYPLVCCQVFECNYADKNSYLIDTRWLSSYLPQA